MIPIIQQIDPQFIDKVKVRFKKNTDKIVLIIHFVFNKAQKKDLNKLIQHNLQKSNKNKRYTRTTNS